MHVLGDAGHDAAHDVAGLKNRQKKLVLGGDSIEHAGVDVEGIYTQSLHIFLFHAVQFLSHRFVEADSTKFRGAVVGETIHSNEPGRGGDSDEMSVVLGDHGWHEGLHRPEVRDSVHLHSLFHISITVVGIEDLLAGYNTGVVDKHGHFSNLVADLLSNSINFFSVCHVNFEGSGTSSNLANHFCSFFCASNIDIPQNHDDASFRELNGQKSTNSRSGSSDNTNLALQALWLSQQNTNLFKYSYGKRLSNFQSKLGKKNGPLDYIHDYLNKN
mmetsp:Transcript_11560/g.25278  ORF Transcript_11560/g.25278 Transcript_11560/m.25278 type:complete len:272 (+) Transcript_11560:242-1057(+)